VKDRYFHAHLDRHWVFTGIVPNADGTPKVVRLFSASSVPIQRHIKVREDANPYDPAWGSYFEARSRRNSHRPEGRLALRHTGQRSALDYVVKPRPTTRA
jgi:RNA-directed DNA polymerase